MTSIFVASLPVSFCHHFRFFLLELIWAHSSHGDLFPLSVISLLPSEHDCSYIFWAIINIHIDCVYGNKITVSIDNWLNCTITKELLSLLYWNMLYIPLWTHYRLCFLCSHSLYYGYMLGSNIIPSQIRLWIQELLPLIEKNECITCSDNRGYSFWVIIP